MKAANYQTSSANWQIELAQAITDPHELLQLLHLDPQLLNNNQFALEQFPLRVPRGFVARMEKGNAADPLLLQVLPLAIEQQQVVGFSRDPLQEKKFNPVPGLLHKYQDRVLLTATGICAINCRYCFRRHFPYGDNNPGQQGWEETISYLKNHTEVKEVILSGGDPLMLKDQPLKELILQIATVPHIKRLRIHSRLPIVLPERITPELIQILTATRLQAVMILHSNHANEIDNSVKFVVQNLRAANIPVLNQSVLLKGINDSIEALINLSETLFAVGIIPYYLHLLDKVQGAAHFDVAEERARDLIQQMTQQLSGYLVPKLVKEEPGALSKTTILI